MRILGLIRIKGRKVALRAFIVVIYKSCLSERIVKIEAVERRLYRDSFNEASLGRIAVRLSILGVRASVVNREIYFSILGRSFFLTERDAVVIRRKISNLG